jgi:hypothetical protein
LEFDFMLAFSHFIAIKLILRAINSRINMVAVAHKFSEIEIWNNKINLHGCTRIKMHKFLYMVHVSYHFMSHTFENMPFLFRPMFKCHSRYTPGKRDE